MAYSKHQASDPPLPDGVTTFKCGCKPCGGMWKLCDIHRMNLIYELRKEFYEDYKEELKK